LVIGLILLLVTRLAWLDSAIAITFGGIIIFTGYKILKETTSNLMDEADFNVLEEIAEILWQYKSDKWIDLHNLKLVKYGDEYHVDCDLTLPWYLNIVEAHVESDKIKERVNEHYLGNVDFTVHTDPCKSELCKNCTISDCKVRVHQFLEEQKWIPIKR